MPPCFCHLAAVGKSSAAVKIPNIEQIRAWDAYTIREEPVASLELMERAANAFVRWFVGQFNEDSPVYIFCGTGNNGGDGLAIARLLRNRFYNVQVVLCGSVERLSPDARTNHNRLVKMHTVPIHQWAEGKPLPEVPAGAVLVDALFGSGLNRPVEGAMADLLEQLNALEGVRRVAVDIPSGMFADRHTPGVSFLAHFTVSFQVPKLGFFFPENAQRVGEWVVVPIGLREDFVEQVETPFHWLAPEEVGGWLHPRRKYDHKGTYGHALLVVGGYGKVGAAVLAAKACLRSGAGLVTVHAPRCAYEILQISFPEAMVSVDEHHYCFSSPPSLKRYKAIGTGCGLGTNPITVRGLRALLENTEHPLVLDADALNILGAYAELFKLLPKGSILTPHPREFERLFGPTPNHFERNALQRRKARELGIFIILKGAHTCIATPNGEAFFNMTGNPGMATGGSGDVLTGVLTGLLAQGYPPREAALLGVCLHGLAGDLAAEKHDLEALLAGDLIDFLGKAFRSLRTQKPRP